MLADVLDRLADVGRHRDGVAIVFANNHKRDFPKRGHVQGFQKCSLAGGTLAEIGDGHAAVFAFLVGERHAGGDRDVRREDGVRAPEILAHIAKVHRASPSLATTILLAEQLGHHRLHFKTFGKCVAVTSIGGEHLIRRLQGGGATHGDGFLTNAWMRGAVEEPFTKATDGVVFKGPYAAHLVIPCQQGFHRKF